ncbi:MAG: hotdog domain-containing protein [Candidatus Kapaibacteriales bacterium]
MLYKTRKLVKPPDLNPSNTLFGGQLLKWIDEEAAVFAMCKFGNNHVVTKYMSEIDFINPAYSGDIVEIGCEVISVGRTSLTLRSEVRIKDTETVIIRIEKIVLVHVDNSGRPKAHGMTLETLRTETITN